MFIVLWSYATHRDPYFDWHSPALIPWYAKLCLHLDTRLVVNASWKNPSQEWHVGCKLVYELFTDTLTSRLKVNFIFSACISNVIYQTWYLNKDLLTTISERKKEEMGRGKPRSNFRGSEAAEWIWKGSQSPLNALHPFWLHHWFSHSFLLFITCTPFSSHFAPLLFSIMWICDIAYFWNGSARR